MSQSTPADSVESNSPDAPNSNINISGDVNTATIGENAQVGQVAVGDNITQTRVEHQVVITEETAYDVRGCENPYLGLSAFHYEDAAKYAGREKLIAETAARITSPTAPIPLLFITGASGSGKSSFAQAGLLPALEKFYQGFDVKHAVMRPAGDPLAALNDALWRQLRVGQNSEVSDNFGILNATPPNQINLLVLDQFEEFFTQAPQTAREQFFAWLPVLPPFAQTRTHIIATMRADYLPELFNHPALYDIAKRGVDLRAMTAEELKQAIQKPLLVSPYAQTKRFEPSLVEKLAEDAAQDATYLPLLQVTLQEIWRKGFLNLAAYTNLTDAIKQRADQVLEYRDFDDANPDEKRDPAQQTAMMSLLLDLVDVSLDDDARRDVRRQRTKTEVTRGNPQRERWVNQLSAARLLSVQQEAQDANRIDASSVGNANQPLGTSVDLIHETLLTNWTRLQSAIAERRSELRRRARFEQNLDEWLTIKLSAQNRSDDYLLDGVRLAEARELEAHDDVALRNEDARAYLRASVARAEATQQAELERERQRAEALEQAKREADMRTQEQLAANARLRQRNLFLAGAFVLAVIAVGAALFFLTQSNANLERAEEQARINKSRALAAQSINKHTQDLGLAYLLGLEAYRESSTLETRNNLFNLRYEDSHRISFLWGHTAGVTSVAFSPDGKTLASGDNDHTIRLWDVATQQQIGELQGHTAEVTNVAFSPDGKTLASGSLDFSILLWDVATQQQIGELKGYTGPALNVAFSPDGKTLASGGNAPTVRLWDVATQQQIGELQGHTAGVTSVAFSPDGKTLASGDNDHTIRLWDVATQQQIGELQGHTAEVTNVAFSPDGKTLASGSQDRTIRLWDVDTRSLLVELKGHTDLVNSVAFSPDGKTLASGSNDKTIRLWDVDTRSLLVELKGHTDLVNSVAFSPDGKTLASGSLDYSILLWDVATQQRGKLKGHTSIFENVAFSPDGKTLASGDNDHTIRLWDVATQQQIGELQGHTTAETNVAFSPDGKTLASGSRDRTIRLWDVATQQQIGELQGHTYWVLGVAFSPDGKTLASGGNAPTVRLWDVATQQKIGELQGHMSFVYSVAFSPDGKTLASGSLDYSILLWDVATQQQIGELQGHTAGVTNVAFSPDGKTLASGSQDRTIRLWDVDTRSLLVELKGHTDLVNSVAFSPDGKTLASGSNDKTIRLWDLDVQSSLKAACKFVNRNLTRAEYAQYINSDPAAYDSVYAKHPTCEGLPVEPLPTPTPSPTP